MFREPLLAPAIAFAAGISLEHYAGLCRTDVLWAVVALLVLAVFARIRKLTRTAFAATVIAIAGLGIISAGLHRPPPRPTLNVSSGETVILEGCIVEPPIFHEGREQFTLEIAPNARVRVSLILDSIEQSPAWRYGQRIEMPARIRMPRNFNNPGAFDYRAFLQRKHIYWTATGKPGPDVHLLPGTCGNRFQAALFDLRQAVLARTSELFGNSKYDEALLDALLIGEPARLERSWTEDYRRTGTYHALVISGLHITIIAAGLLFLLRLVFVPREAALLVATVAAWLYGFASGGSSPAIRSAALFTCFAAASILYRRARLLNLLAATALLFLAFDPAQLFDTSFQLSFLAVGAIGALAQPVLDATSEPWRDGLKALHDSRPDHRLAPHVAETRIELRYLAEAAGWPRLVHLFEAMLRSARWIWSGAMLTSFVQIGLILPSILYFHRVPVTSVTANLIATPLLTACVPLGFLALATGWNPFVRLTSLGVTVAKSLVEWQAQWEPSWRIPDPPLLLGAATLVVIVVAAHRKHIATSLLAALMAGGLVVGAFQKDAPQGKLQLQVLDVGQGDSMLLTLPEGRRMLIDGGGIPAFGKGRRPQLDIGEDVVSPYLWRLGVHNVDIVVLTHAHEDHAGGLRALIENFRPREIWSSANNQGGEAWQRIKLAAASTGATLKQFRAGMQWRQGPLQFQVLSPAQDYQPESTPGNNDSLALQVTYGRHRFLLTGDMEKYSEVQLLGKLEKIDILKVAHHGSRTSTTVDFLKGTRPAAAIVSVGEGNLYRHPHAEVLRRLETMRIATYRTDTMGLITVESDGRYLDVQPFRWPVAE